MLKEGIKLLLFRGHNAGYSRDSGYVVIVYN